MSDYRDEANALASLKEKVADPLRDPVGRLADLYSAIGTKGIESLTNEEINLMSGMTQVRDICADSR